MPEYYIAKTPVTNAQYAAFVRTTLHKPPGHWPRALESPAGKENHPVVEVSWYDAWAYCYWLAEVTGKTYRLPIEAEWEKAARGTDGRIYPWGDDQPDKTRCNYVGNVGNTTPVGQYSPQGDSPYGCVDMAGNVWEWVNDRYDIGHYVSSPSQNPKRPKAGTLKVLRGGSWDSVASLVRAAYRYHSHPGVRVGLIGFRCAADLGE